MRLREDTRIRDDIETLKQCCAQFTEAVKEWLFVILVAIVAFAPIAWYVEIKVLKSRIPSSTFRIGDQVQLKDRGAELDSRVSERPDTN